MCIYFIPQTLHLCVDFPSLSHTRHTVPQFSLPPPTFIFIFLFSHYYCGRFLYRKLFKSCVRIRDSFGNSSGIFNFLSVWRNEFNLSWIFSFLSGCVCYASWLRRRRRRRSRRRKARIWIRVCLELCLSASLRAGWLGFAASCEFSLVCVRGLKAEEIVVRSSKLELDVLLSNSAGNFLMWEVYVCMLLRSYV